MTLQLRPGTLSIVELADTVGTLARACRDRTIDRGKLVGGTFTISNVGSYGGLFATPIINLFERECNLVAVPTGLLRR